MSGDGEFEFIRRRLAPLAASYPGAFDLGDDGAVLQVPEAHELVVTTDTLISGVHFLPDDPPESVAIKVIRASVSDLTAMGAEPQAALLSISWPPDAADDLRTRFVDGLAVELRARDIALIGGDTTVTPGPWTLTGTLFGSVPKGQVLRRSGAQAGDILAMTGTVGDAGLGLLALTGTLAVDASDRAEFVERYRIPPVRSELVDLLRDHASAALDISDGLLADAAHIADQSGVALKIELNSILVSDAADHWLSGEKDKPVARIRLATSGDDYEILFSCRPDAWPELMRSAIRFDVPITRIGRVVTGQGVRVLDEDGKPLDIAKAGFTHF
tara:strand:+ start:1123 stop:2109 length:987 start_codon:yes stop_codon:yes gene_type:complete